MKRTTIGSIVVTGIGIAAFAFTPLSAYGRKFSTFVTLSPATPDNGYINVKGPITAGTSFIGNGVNLTNVKAATLTLPMTASSTSSGIALTTVASALNITSSDPSNASIVVTQNDASGTGINVNSPAEGIMTVGTTGNGISAFSSSGNGVYATSNTGYGGVFASTGAGTTALAGWNYGGGGYGVFAYGGLGASGTKSFVIDDPRDPANATIRHYSEEGPQPLNVYIGSVTTDAKGYATVQLPSYFDTINKAPRYQLTVVDTSDSPDFVLAKVVKKESGNQFTIRTSKSNIEVSWRVEAVRNDPWVQRNGAPVEEQKAPANRGKYLSPELYGKPISAGMPYSSSMIPSGHSTTTPPAK